MLRQCIWNGKVIPDYFINEHGNVYSNKTGTKNPMHGRGMINIPLDIHYKKVMCIETGETFDCVSAAAKKYNVEAGNIGRVCNGKRKTCGGYHWEYLK